MRLRRTKPAAASAGAIATLLAVTVLVGAVPGVPCSAGASTEPEDFRMKTAEDLFDLCSTPTNDPNYVAAIHFCHGFAAGAYQYDEAISGRKGKPKLYCLPDPPPTRNEAMGEFVTWAKANPSVFKERPVDGLFRFLGQRYPCAK